MNVADKKVTIVGAGKSGVSVADLVKHKGGTAKISDQSSPQSLPKDIVEKIEREDFAVEWGEHTKEFIEDSDLVVVSPGVNIHADPIEWAKAKGIEVVGEVEFAAQLCPCPIIAVTGSNGKTTVATLIADVINQSGARACLCGNIGTPFSSKVLELESYDYVVLEVSSFQLETIKSFKPKIAIFLNFSQNHLDRHKGLQEYFDLKSKIFINQTQEDYAVLNAQDEQIRSLADQCKAQMVFFNEKSDDDPNFSAVLTVAQILDIKEGVVEEIFNQFKGVEHRLEWVRTLNDIEFVNDSKATTTEATRWAIEHLEKPIHLVCGGRDKNVDFTVLSELIENRVKTIAAFGEASDKIKSAFESCVDVRQCAGLEQAVEEAKNQAKAGECVLLSPMCTSFDMFKSFEERGKLFKEIVNELS